MVKSTNSTRRVTTSSVKKSSVAVEIPPSVVKGSHLTVYTYADGRTRLEWDDEALARDVREAIEAYELSQLKPVVKAKSATRKKKTKDVAGK